MTNEANLTPDIHKPVTVQHLVHVICVPLQVKRKKDGKNLSVNCIEAMAEGLITAKDSQWEKCDNPWASPLPKEKIWQARVYFHPFVRRFLFDPQRVRWLQRCDINSMQVKLPNAEATVTLKVERCLLALFQPDIACLLLELDYRCGTDDQPAALSIEQLQWMLNRLRRTYPSNFPYTQPDKQPKSSVTLLNSGGKPIGDPGFYEPEYYEDSLDCAANNESWKPGWAQHWKTLLHPLNPDKTQENGWGIRQFGDDSAAIMSYIALDDVRALNRGHWVRLCFADKHADDSLPYAKHFLRDFEAKHCFDRYWYKGSKDKILSDSNKNPSRIMNCGYAFTYAGNQNDKEFFAEAALFNFRHIYVFMGLIAHMQRAALLAASHRLTHMVDRDKGDITLPDRDKVREFYDQFVEFTQVYWFDEVTPQEQGQQIFAQWQQHLRIQPLYNEVRQELRDLAEYSELRASNQLNDNVARLGLASLVLAALAVLSGLLGMNILKADNTSISIDNSWTMLLWGANRSWLFVAPFGLAALFGAVAFAFLLRSWLPLRWRRSRKSNHQH